MISVTSIAARNGRGGGAVLYASAKGFVSTVTHGWAKEVVGGSIWVNAVSPEVIATPFHERYCSPQHMKGECSARATYGSIPGTKYVDSLRASTHAAMKSAEMLT